MKNIINRFAAVALLALVLVSSSFAAQITGSISFNGTPKFDTVPISDATAIASYDSAWVAVDQQTGTYASVADLTPVVFSPFMFSPATQAVTPMWSFQSLGSTFSFSTTSMMAIFNDQFNIWNFGGKGILSATGFEDTVGDWNFSTGQIGQSFYFGSAAAASPSSTSIPDSGMTVVLLCLGVGLVGFARHCRLITI